jgi:hypothetical protein
MRAPRIPLGILLIAVATVAALLALDRKPPPIIGFRDLITVEVRPEIPGRPLEGERAIRPDGTITLDIYGDVAVGGLTTDQAAANIDALLRRHPSAPEGRASVRISTWGDPIAEKKYGAPSVLDTLSRKAQRAVGWR